MRQFFSQCIPKPARKREVHLLRGGDDDVIIESAQNLAQIPEAFPDLPLHAIALHGGAPRLQRDAQPIVADIVRNAEDDALREPNDLVLAEEAPVLPRVVESVRIGQSVRA
jgi:hypothetical protein